jgi:predicted O-methyltransferase YrrM
MHDYLYPMNPFKQALRYMVHQAAETRSTDPFLKKFRQEVLRDDMYNPDYMRFESVRRSMLQNHSLVHQHDPGAGSRVKKSQRTVAEFTRLASVRPRYGRMLYRLARFVNPPAIVELGTAVGLGTLYLSGGCPWARVITVEGNPTLAGLASENFRSAGAEQITVIRDNFDDVLPGLTGQIPDGSLVYIDGNHTGEALQRYFSFFAEHVNMPVIVLDDINWSESMHRAWVSLRRNTLRGLWVDLFQMGIYMEKYAADNQFVRFRY